MVRVRYETRATNVVERYMKREREREEGRVETVGSHGGRGMVGPERPLFVLFGSSIVQFSFSNDGWGATLADIYARKVRYLVRDLQMTYYYDSLVKFPDLFALWCFLNWIAYGPLASASHFHLIYLGECHLLNHRSYFWPWLYAMSLWLNLCIITPSLWIYYIMYLLPSDNHIK